jgi:hypothetical protein
MLKTEYIRDGRNQIMGSSTSGFANGDTVARDRSGKILGHSKQHLPEHTRRRGQIGQPQ